MNLPSAPAVQPGDRLDRYELLCPVAQGGMAMVWVARLSGKHGFEKLFAIKMIRPDHALDASFEEMFLNEARIAARIQHPNVASIVELGEWHDILYMVMEWVDGDSVSRIVRSAASEGTPVPVGVACRIVADVLGGLHAAHELRGADGVGMGVVHRDVSPQNILVSTAGNTKLIDFGIAKARDRLGNETTTGVVKGKFAYMSPEQASGKPIDRTTDIWAAGAVLYYLLSGQHPFGGDNPLAMLHELLSDTPPPALPAHVPPDVLQIIRRALERERVNRYPTAEQMQRDIETAMARSGVLTSAADVAVFVNRLTADRVAARKNAIDLAVSSMSARRHLNEVLTTAFPSVGSAESPAVVETRTSVRPMEVAVEVKTDVTLATLAGPGPGSSRRRRSTSRSAVLGMMAGIATLALCAGVAPMLRPRTDPTSSLGAAPLPPAAAVGGPSASPDALPFSAERPGVEVAPPATASISPPPPAKPPGRGSPPASSRAPLPVAVGRAPAGPPPRATATRTPSPKPERNGELGF
jgi:serine/threonine-protein kinase